MKQYLATSSYRVRVKLNRALGLLAAALTDLDPDLAHRWAQAMA